MAYTKLKNHRSIKTLDQEFANLETELANPSGVSTLTNPVRITSASATALSVGLTGATNPAFNVDASTASQAAGLKVTGATAAGNVAVAVISSGSDANLLINAKGTGTIGIGSVSTGAVTITPATTVTGTLAATNAATVGTTLGVTGVITPTGGVAAAGGFSVTPTLVHTGGVPAQISTGGTEATAVITELYVAEVFIPCNMTVTGVAHMVGATTDGFSKVMLFNSAGTRVAISATTDVSGVSGDTYFRIAFSAPYAAVGPATYYVGVMCDTGTNTINTHTFGNFRAGKITSLTYATEAGYATITPPTTFTTALGPIASLY